MRMISLSEMRVPLGFWRTGVLTVCIVWTACILANVHATGADISFEMLTAARAGDLDTVKKLLTQGQDVNAANADGVTALMVAASENRQAVVRALLDAGADARMKTATGKTAAFFASGKGNTEVAKILEEAASKPPVVPKVSLLVTADYDCTWKLDGESQGRLASGDSVKVQVELGKHLIEAVTGDGTDRFRQVVELTKMQQELVTIGLKAVYDRRLQSGDQAKAAATLTPTPTSGGRGGRGDVAPPSIARPPEAISPEEERRRDALRKRVWSDKATGLTWAMIDNGADVNWNEAVSYCAGLTVNGSHGWRLPEILELAGLHDHLVISGSCPYGDLHVKGGIQLTSCTEWSATQDNSRNPGEHDLMLFSAHDKVFGPLSMFGNPQNPRALCVRRAGK